MCSGSLLYEHHLHSRPLEPPSPDMLALSVSKYGSKTSLPAAAASDGKATVDDSEVPVSAIVTGLKRTHAAVHKVPASLSTARRLIQFMSQVGAPSLSHPSISVVPTPNVAILLQGATKHATNVYRLRKGAGKGAAIL